MQLRSFAGYYWGMVIRPARTFAHLITDGRMLKFGAIAVAIMALLYTAVYVFLIFGGGLPFKPWLDIPPEQYYRYNVFFCAPAMFFGWLLAAAVVHVLSLIMRLHGTFDQVLACFGFGIGIASWSTGIHDIVTSFLGAIHVIDQRQYEIALNSPTVWRTLLWVQMGIYLVWFICLFGTAARSVYRSRFWQAALLGVTGFVIYQGFFLIFNR